MQGPNVPVLSMGAAREAILSYLRGRRTIDHVDSVPGTTRFSSAVVTLLATVAYHRSGTQPTDQGMGEMADGCAGDKHNKSLAATIELSLASPMFLELGSDARELLGVLHSSLTALMRATLNGCFQLSQRNRHRQSSVSSP